MTRNTQEWVVVEVEGDDPVALIPGDVIEFGDRTPVRTLDMVPARWLQAALGLEERRKDSPILVRRHYQDDRQRQIEAVAALLGVQNPGAQQIDQAAPADRGVATHQNESTRTRRGGGTHPTFVVLPRRFHIVFRGPAPKMPDLDRDGI